MHRSPLHPAAVSLRRLARVKLSRALWGAMVWCVLLSALDQPRMAIAEVQSQTFGGSNASSQSGSFTSNNAAGNLLIAAVFSFDATGAATVSVGDSRNTYSQAGAYATNGISRMSLWYARNCGAGANTVTVTTTANNPRNIEVAIFEFSGADTAAPLDATSNSTGTGSSFSTGTVPVSGPGELVIGAFLSTNGWSSFSPAAGWSGGDYSPGGSDEGPGVCWDLQSANVAVTATVNSAQSYAGVGASFFPSTAINAGEGAFTLTGLPATFQSSQFPAGEGTFALTGKGATFNGSLVAGEGAFALTGESATFAGVWYAAPGVFQINAISQGENVIPLVGAGGLFTRLGKLVGALNDLNAFRGGDLPGQLTRAIVDALAQLDGDPSLLIRATEATLPAAQTQAVSALTAMAKSLQAAGQNLLITMANNDVPLSALSVTAALTLLKQQMLAGAGNYGSYTGAYYVNPQTLGYGWAPTDSNRGNGNLVVGVRDAQGFQLDNLLGEGIAVTVYSDATAGAEQLQLLGAASVTDALSSAWPGGSAMSKVLTSLLDTASGNLVTNGSFETFNGGTAPTSWTIVTGTPGADFTKDTTHQYLGLSSLKFIGGTGALSQITQAQTTLAARTPYALNVQIKADVVPAAGVLVIDLYDGANVLADEAGNLCSLSIDLSKLSTAYAPYSIVWQIADRIPPSVKLRVRLTTAISAGSNVYLDSLAMQAATRLGTQLGDSGWGAVFSGSVNWTLRDSGTLTIANSRTCQWQPAFDRFFNGRQAGFVLPTTGTTLIPDSLIGD